MKPQYLNDLTSSFTLFIDNEVCKQGAAFSNVSSGKLSLVEDPAFNGYKVYQSQFKQWSYNSDLSSDGAIIASGVRVGANFVPKGSSGLKIDYNMGRVFFSGASIPTSTSVFASFSIKDFNVYLTTKGDTDLLFEKRWTIKDKSPMNSRTGVLDKMEDTYPAIFIKYQRGENVPFAFGGLDQANYDFRCTVLSDDAYKLDAVISILQDAARKHFPLIASSGIPFNKFGDFKSGISGFSYSDISHKASNLVYINRVRVSRFDERVNKMIKEDMWGAFVDFDLDDIRYPRATTK